MAEKVDLAPLKAKITDILGLDFLVDDDLLAATSIVNLAQGQVLFNQGEMAHSCFVVISGSLKIAMKSKSTESVLAIISKGEFGGVLLMGGPPACYPGSVIGLTPVCLLVIPKETYINYWTKHPKALNFVNNCVQSRMRYLQEDKILQLSDVESRVIAFLYRHYIEKKDLISKKITRKDIALSIGAKTETVIRAFKKLERAGVVKTNRSIINILDKSYFIQNINHEE